MIITGLMVVFIVAGAMILRFFFNVDLVGYEEILAFFALWLYMIGSAYGSYEKSQITADILTIMMQESRLKSSITLLAHFLTLVLGFVFMVWAYQFAAWSFSMNMETPVWRLPTIIGEGSVFIGLLLVSFYNTVYFIDECKLFIKEFKKPVLKTIKTVKGGE
jgi:TRAP-type C4-dicarboxylate transport system permease small subunit